MICYSEAYNSLLTDRLAHHNNYYYRQNHAVNRVVLCLHKLANWFLLCNLHAVNFDDGIKILVFYLQSLQSATEEATMIVRHHMTW